MKIVIVGSGGRLGAALAREWRALGDEVTGFNRAALDIADAAAIDAALEPLAFDVLVNCAAQTNVDRCETEVEEAFRLNAKAPVDLGHLCHRKGARFVHISTDYVFDGAKTAPYSEVDEARPISIYGTSKKAGEEGALTATHGAALVVRVSWVFGPDRPSFVDQILQRALEQDAVAAIADKVAAPTYTLDAARLLRSALSEVRASGVLHLCNEGACTWQEYGQFALDIAAETGVLLRARTVAPQRMADLKAFIAKRPVQTAMSTARLTSLTGEKPRPWREAVEEYVRSVWAPAQPRS